MHPESITEYAFDLTHSPTPQSICIFWMLPNYNKSRSIIDFLVDYSCCHRELLNAMQDKEAGIPLQSFEIDGCMYKHCFTGSQFNRVLSSELNAPQNHFYALGCLIQREFLQILGFFSTPQTIPRSPIYLSLVYPWMSFTIMAHFANRNISAKPLYDIC